MTGHTALYARVSTADQNLSRQKEETYEYAVDTLGVAPPTSKSTPTKEPGGTLSPPFGFDVNDGYLTPNEDYDTAVAILERIEKGESKQSTARFAGVSRSMVGRILDRAELYRDHAQDAATSSKEASALF